MMKLKDYIKGLKGFIKDHPKAKNYEVVTSIDDEGNVLCVLTNRGL